MPYTLTHTQELAQNSMVRSSMKKPTIMDVCKSIVESIQQDADIDIFANYVCATCLKSFNGSSKPGRCSCGSFNIRVPCVNAKSLRIAIKKIEDARTVKRKQVVGRAKELLKKIMDESVPETDEITDEVKRSVQMAEITSYKGLPAGPGIDSADSVILVEGRADVINMLKCGIKNTVAIGGTNVPKTIVDLSKQKTTIAFVDGDRGGGMILKELSQIADVDFIAQAPRGKEVEELGKKEVIMSLRRKIPLSQMKNHGKRIAREGIVQVKEDLSKEKENDDTLLNLLNEVKGELSARLYDEKLGLIAEMEIKDLIDSLADVQPHAVVFDGIVTQRLVDVAADNGVKYLVGVNRSSIANTKNLKVLTRKK